MSLRAKLAPVNFKDRTFLPFPEQSAVHNVLREFVTCANERAPRVRTGIFLASPTETSVHVWPAGRPHGAQCLFTVHHPTSNKTQAPYTLVEYPSIPPMTTAQLEDWLAQLWATHAFSHALDKAAAERHKNVEGSGFFRLQNGRHRYPTQVNAHSYNVLMNSPIGQAVQLQLWMDQPSPSLIPDARSTGEYATLLCQELVLPHYHILVRSAYRSNADMEWNVYGTMRWSEPTPHYWLPDPLTR
jgi:hypothetical protein